jgi:hypothetical protein
LVELHLLQAAVDRADLSRRGLQIGAELIAHFCSRSQFFVLRLQRLLDGVVPGLRFAALRLCVCELPLSRVELCSELSVLVARLRQLMGALLLGGGRLLAVGRSLRQLALHAAHFLCGSVSRNFGRSPGGASHNLAP